MTKNPPLMRPWLTCGFSLKLMTRLSLMSISPNRDGGRTPVTVTTFWFALEDATLNNGCLWVEVGGQRGPLRERFVRSGDVVTMEKLDTTPWPDGRTAIPLEVKAGTLVVFHGLLPHYSAPNRSAHSRHAYTLHVTDGLSAYAPTNWIQRGADFPVRGFV